MPYTQNDVGKTCEKCGQGKLVLNPKTGKIFCDKKCWLDSGTQGTGQTISTSYVDLRDRLTRIEAKIDLLLKTESDDNNIAF